MDQQEPRVVDRDQARQRHPGEETEFVFVKRRPDQRPRDAAEVFEAVLADNGHVLGHAMVMVAAHHKVGLAPDPVNTGLRLQGVIDKVAEAQANVARFGNGLQGGPVAVDVGHEEDTHTAGLLRETAPVVI
jgi:hypothetical protein